MLRGNLKNTRLKYNYLLGEIDYIINDCLSGYATITQTRICEEYMKISDNSLVDELAGFNLTLPGVIELTFSKTFHVVNDSVEPIFIRLALMNKPIMVVSSNLNTNSIDMKAIEGEGPLITEPSSPSMVAGTSADHEALFQQFSEKLERSLQEDTVKEATHCSKDSVSELIDESFRSDFSNFSLNFAAHEVLERESVISSVLHDTSVLENLTVSKAFVDEEHDDVDPLKVSNVGELETDHFYDSEFENGMGLLTESVVSNDSPASVCVEPYRSVNGVIVNYQRAFAQREKMLKNITSSMFNDPVILNWSNSVSDFPCIIEILKQLHEIFPSGCTVAELCCFEEKLKHDNTHFGFNTTLPALICLINNRMLRYDSKGFYTVAPELVAVRVQRLKKNFCSNLYRLLSSHDDAMTIGELVPFFSILVPPSSSCKASSVLRLCNRYPLIFRLECNGDDYKFENAIVRLNPHIPSWQIQFDCAYNMIDGTLCDCCKCFPFSEIDINTTDHRSVISGGSMTTDSSLTTSQMPQTTFA